MAGILNLSTVPPGASRAAVGTYRLSRALRARLGNRLREAGDINIIEWRILVGVSTMTEASQRDLVDFTTAEQAQVSRSLTALENKGLITTRRSNDDRRARLYKLSAKGRTLFDSLLPQISTYNSAIDAALNEEEMTRFLDFCERIAKAASNIQVEESLEKMPEQA